MAALASGPNLISHIGKLAFERNYRSSRGLCLVSGKKLLRDMGKHHVFEDVLLLQRLHKKFFPKGDGVPDTPFPMRSTNTPVSVPDELLQRLSGTKEADGVFAAASLKIPPPASASLGESESLVLAFDSSLSSSADNTQRIATILRSAVAFNFHSVNFCDKFPDLFAPESVRASQGALWTMPYRVASLSALVSHASRMKLALVQLVVNSETPEKTPLRLKSTLKGKQGAVLLVTSKPRKEFTYFNSALGLAPFQVGVSGTLYELRRHFQ